MGIRRRGDFRSPSQGLGSAEWLSLSRFFFCFVWEFFFFLAFWKAIQHEQRPGLNRTWQIAEGVLGPQHYEQRPV